MKRNSVKLEDKKIINQFRIAAGISLVTIFSGTVFYHFVEDLNWLDALYFCVITLTTIGYGDIVPHTDIGKAFTIFYVLLGVGIIAAFVNLAIRRASLQRKNKQ